MSARCARSRAARSRSVARPQGEALDPLQHMSHPDDWSDFRHCIRLTREIFGQPAFDAYRGRELSPGSHVETDAEFDAFIRDHAESAYHPCGTCRMGRADDPLSVVDPECRVIGVEGLRVADSLDLPAGDQRQSQRALDHGRREGRRPHTRPGAAAAVQPGTLDQSTLAGRGSIELKRGGAAREGLLRAGGTVTPSPEVSPKAASKGLWGISPARREITPHCSCATRARPASATAPAMTSSRRFRTAECAYDTLPALALAGKGGGSYKPASGRGV